MVTAPMALTIFSSAGLVLYDENLCRAPLCRMRRGLRPLGGRGLLKGARGRGKGRGAVPRGRLGERRFPLTGRVVSADPRKGVLVVSHDEVKGYMPAMTMEFRVSPGDASAATEGERIRATLVVEKGGDLRLEAIWPDDKAVQDSVDAGAKMLHQDTIEKGRAAYREVGDTVPQFVLFDQNARVVDSARFHGKQVMLNFIYSRCPVANMCPLSTANFWVAIILAVESGHMFATGQRE